LFAFLYNKKRKEKRTINKRKRKCALVKLQKINNKKGGAHCVVFTSKRQLKEKRERKKERI
jgi:hypothetical protein